MIDATTHAEEFFRAQGKPRSGTDFLSTVIPRTLRPTAILPIKIQGANTISLGCTLDISRTGIKVQIDNDLAPGEHVTVYHGLRKMPFRVVWTKQERNTFLAGLVSLEQPLHWGQVAEGG